MKSLRGNLARLKPVLYWVLWLFSFVIVAHYGTLDLTNVLFIGAAAVSYACVLMKPAVPGNGKRSAGRAVVLWLIAVYYTFSLFGRSIFMQQARFENNIQRIVNFILLVPVLYPTAPGLIAVMEKLASGKYTSNPEKQSRLTGVICGLLTLGVVLLLTAGYYPCTTSVDSLTHWRQANGLIPLTDYHTVAFNLLLKGLFALVNAKTPYIFVVFQAALLSAVIGNLACFLSCRGVSRKPLVFGTLVFALCPSTYMLCLYLSKNPLTAILGLGTVVSLAEVMVEPAYYFKKPFWYVKTILIISSLYLVRQNNIVILIPLVLFCVWFLFRHRKAGRRILVLIGGAACVVGLMEGVVYPGVDYKHMEKPHETVRPLLAPAASALQQGLMLPDDVLETMEKILPLDEWKDRYFAFDSDGLTWGTPRPDYSKVTLSEAFAVYFRMLGTYPDVVIRDRLDGMNLIWDIRRVAARQDRCPDGIIDGAEFIDAVLQPEGIPGKALAAVKSIASSLLRISSETGILDVFIWGNGIYVYLLMVIAVFLAGHRKAHLLWIAGPAIFILLTYVLVIAWQNYCYIWFFPLAVLFLLFVSIVETGKPSDHVNVGTVNEAV